MLNQRLIAILEGRGFEIETLARHGVTGCADRGPEWIAIPFVEAERTINHKYRTVSGDKRFSQDAGAKKIFWNVDCLLDEALDTQPLIITEGELDALSAIQAGFTRTVSVPDGAPAVEIGDKETAKYAFLDSAPRLNSITEIILATDVDSAGANLMNDLAHRLGRARCKWVRYPKGCKDLNDALRLYGNRGVVETINRAQWVKVPGVARMSELPPLRDQPIYEVGVPGLEDHFRIRPGDLSVVIGIPGHGKTALINAVTGHMALRHGWVIGSASFEQRAQVDYRRNLRTFHAGRRFVNMSEEETAAADRWIDEKYALLVPDVEDEVNLEWMLERCQVAIVQYGAKMIAVDPINEMDHYRPPDMTETDYIGFMLKSWKRLAFRFQVHVMLAVHPAKLQRGKDGKYPIPSLYDAAGSAHYYNKPDAGIIVHRIDKEKTLIRVAKSKYHDLIGTPDDVEVSFDISTGRYRAIDGNEPPSTHWNND
jgi:twinkle protein